MVLLIVGACWPGSRRSATVAAGAGLVALAAELLRLHHDPALDAFRATVAGSFLLGHVFSPWNVVAYWLGIGATLPNHLFFARMSRERAWPRATLQSGPEAEPGARAVHARPGRVASPTHGDV
jgi:hypothetical protein